MNTKSSWVLLAIVIVAVIFVPLIPNDSPIECNGVDVQTCDSNAGYLSIYTKFIK